MRKKPVAGKSVAQPSKRQTSVQRIDLKQLMNGERCLIIEFAGEEYRIELTETGGVILVK